MVSIVAGVATMVFGLLFLIFRRAVMRAVRWGLERFFGREFRDIITDPERERWVGVVVPIGFMVIGLVTALNGWL